MRPAREWSTDRAREILQQIHEPGPVLLALQAVQEEFGYVPADAVPLVAEVFNVSRADVYGVLTFYRDLRQEPVPEGEIQVCMGEACQAVGARDLRRAARTLVGDDAVRDVFCLGNCALGPTAVVSGRLVGRANDRELAHALDDSRGAS